MNRLATPLEFQDSWTTSTSFAWESTSWCGPKIWRQVTR